MTHSELIQNGGPQQMVQKLQEFCDKLRWSDLSKYNLSELLNIIHSMQYLANKCSVFSSDISSKLQTQQLYANQMAAEFHEMKESKQNYINEIKQIDKKIENIDQQIQQLLAQKSQHKEKKKIIQNKLSDVVNKRQNVFRTEVNVLENMKQPKILRNALQNQTLQSKQFTIKLLHQIESISMKSWDRNNFIGWILCINDGYFRQTKYEPFIEALRNTQHIIIDKQMNESLLKTWGLTDNIDINIFMMNYQRLINKQSEIK